MSVDWSTSPGLGETWANRDLAIRGRDESNAMMDHSGDSNYPTGTIDWSITNSRFEAWSGSAWGALVAKYLINVDQVDGLDFPGTIGNILTDHNKTNHDSLGIDAATLSGNDITYYDDVPNTSRVPFYLASAPTGYVQVTSVNDQVLRAVSGTGGGTGGSWTVGGITVDGHTLSLSEIPAHTHTGSSLTISSAGSHWHYTGVVFVNDSNHKNAYGNEGYSTHAGHTGTGKGADSTSSSNYYEGQTDTEAAHNHTVSGSTGSNGSGGSHSHGLTSDGTWRPAYINVIICERSK